MGQIESAIMPHGPRGTFRPRVESDEPDEMDFIGQKHDSARRPTLIDKISRQISLVPGSLAETEILVNAENKTHIDHRANGISNMEAGIQLFKVLVGTGILFMPKAFMVTGVLEGIVLTAGITCLTIMLNGFVIQAAHYFSKINRVSCYSFSDTARLSFKKWPAFARFGNAAQYFISLLIFLCSYSIMFIDVGIVANSLVDICQMLDYTMSYYTAVWLQLPFYIACNIAPGLKRLTPITIGALAFLWTGIGLTTYYIINHLAEEGAQDVATWEGWHQLPQYCAITLLGFNSIAALTSIENNMKKPEDFIGTPSVVCCVLSLAGVLYCAYGILGYYAFGALTKGPILDSILPTSFSMVAVVLKSCITIGLLLTNPILFFPVLSVVSDFIDLKFNSFCITIFSRLIQICFLVVVPLLLKDVMVMMQLLGGFFITLQYLMPIVVETLTFWDTRKGYHKFLIALRNLILTIIGILVIGVTFYSGVNDFMNGLNKK